MVEWRTKRRLAHSLYDAWIHLRVRPCRGDGMRTIAGLLLMTLLALSAGCAKTDWIDRTLVTVNVTGAWYGIGERTGTIQLELEQQGSTVKGVIRTTVTREWGLGTTSASIDGTVAGDVFRFRDTRGRLEGELTVSGDEMNGQMSWGLGPRPTSLRRVDPSSPPISPPR